MPLPLTIHWRSFQLPKRGHTAAEYEDACAGDATTGRFAVADGASESSHAALWARLLAEAYVAAGVNGDKDWLAGTRQRWAKEVDGPTLSWFAEIKSQEGAFATFLGLAFAAAEHWQAAAVGDCCVFQVRGGDTILSFPLTGAEQFGNAPSLLGSRPGRDPGPRNCEGTWRPGDRFLLATDALAQWFLVRAEAGEALAPLLTELLGERDPESAFVDLVEKARDHDGLRNDDVCLLLIDPAPCV